jgi:hypothetical protein
VIQGAWDDPLLLPGIQVLMKRSPAASPLYEIRNRAAAAPRPGDEECADATGPSHCGLLPMPAR